MQRDHDTEPAAAELRRLFAGMDARDDAAAVRAMKEAEAFLRRHNLSFGKIVQQIEEHGLLLPTNIGKAIWKMDSTTLSEAESLFGSVRNLMKSCGLTFERIIAAYEESEQLRRFHQANLDENEQLRRAYQAMLDENKRLRAARRVAVFEDEPFHDNAWDAAACVQKARAELPVKIFLVAAAMLLSLWFPAFVADLFWPGAKALQPPTPQNVSATPSRDPPVSPSPPAPQQASPAQPALSRAPLRRSHVPNRERISRCARADCRDYDLWLFPDPPWRDDFECWRNRSLRGSCFQ